MNLPKIKTLTWVGCWLPSALPGQGFQKDTYLPISIFFQLMGFATKDHSFEVPIISTLLLTVYTLCILCIAGDLDPQEY